MKNEASQKLWCMKGGKHGENEARFLSEGRIEGWFGDFSDCKTLEEVTAMIRNRQPHLKKAAAINYGSQMHALMNRMKKGDLIALPLKTTKKIAIGRLSNKTGYSPDKNGTNGGNWRKVNWLEKDLDRSLFGQDIRNSFGAFITICQITKNDALTRVKSILSTGVDPRWHGENNIVDTDEEEGPLDLVQAARDRLVGLIEARFKGHNFTTLIADLLRARGYEVKQSPPGPDGGIDLVAAPSPWGKNLLSIVVQVKSGGRTGQDEIQKLIGNHAETGTDLALIVSWGGFKKGMESKLIKKSVKIRLWDSDKVISEIESNYEALNSDIKSQLPLEWTLVPRE
nr:restriction endonuclease [Euryarchaeota archaeon]